METRYKELEIGNTIIEHIKLLGNNYPLYYGNLIKTDDGKYQFIDLDLYLGILTDFLNEDGDHYIVPTAKKVEEDMQEAFEKYIKGR